MRKFILMLLLSLPIISTANLSKTHEHWKDKIFGVIVGFNVHLYVIHPSGELWWLTCDENKKGEMICSFKKRHKK